MCKQALALGFALASQRFHLALPYGRFSPSGKAPLTLRLCCLHFRSVIAYGLHFPYTACCTFRKHTKLWRFLALHTS